MKRILITIAGQGSIASIIRSGLLNKMQVFCIPVIGILWDQADLYHELISNDIEVYKIPNSEFSNEYLRLRSQINFIYQYKILKTPSTQIEINYKRNFINRFKRIKQYIQRTKLKVNIILNPTTYQNLIKTENEILQNEPYKANIEQWLNRINVDGIYSVTPFLPEVELIGRILQKQGKFSLAAIHSFDNITKRPWSPIHFDSYSVWNKYNKSELLRIFNTLSKSCIYVNGAPQFDFHFDKKFLLDEDEWRRLLGITDNRKIILYAGGWKGLTPNEEQYVCDIIDGIRNGAIENKPIFLLRGHPLDRLDRWENVKAKYPEIIMDVLKQGTEKFDFTNLTEIDIQRFCSTLHYTDVHVNLVSTMAVDGAAHNKPQIAPYYDNIKAQKDLRNLYYQEHYVPVVKSGGLTLAKDAKSLQQTINEALKEPEKFIQNNDNLLREIITYTDGKSSERVLKYLKENIG